LSDAAVTRNTPEPRGSSISSIRGIPPISWRRAARTFPAYELGAGEVPERAGGDSFTKCSLFEDVPKTFEDVPKTMVVHNPRA
jgi:hypothetical protein